MSFASLVFFVFLAVVFALYYAHPSRRWQNWVLLLASYFFYGWWDFRFAGLMLGASLVDFGIGWQMARAATPRRRRWLLALTLCTNLGLLGFFKYFNFFADSFAVLMAGFGVDVSTTTLNIVLPVGISFYTFQTLSYTLDIYRGQFEPRRDVVEYLTFVSFFPQLVAGPIERASDLLPQFSKTRFFSESAAVEGCRLMLWGLAKKMILADNLGAIADNIFSRASTATGAELVLGTVCFAFQIYCDFSAYSEIATGTAKLFGIQLSRNFAYPYFAQSISDFWRRWHISLSTWFRDYIYIPLGGNRVSSSRTSANIMATMLLSGLWHGAAWHFVLWGGLNGAFLACSRAKQIAGGEIAQVNGRAILRIARTFLLVCAAWILFRAESVSAALAIYRRIGSDLFAAGFYASLMRLAREHALLLTLLLLLLGIEWKGRDHWNPLRLERLPIAVRWAAYTGVFWAILYLGTGRSADFIYFQF